MNACGHDCEYCELVETCAQTIAIEFKANRERESDSRKVETPCDTCPLHAVLEARLGRMEDLVARMKREMEQ